uniref:Uncharacterized protein n=1 Tax=candidate division WOR-3 bacterium TaxID=2052148 RepID=A0A7V3PTC1_UNCW3
MVRCRVWKGVGKAVFGRVRAVLDRTLSGRVGMGVLGMEDNSVVTEVSVMVRRWVGKMVEGQVFKVMPVVAVRTEV